MRKLGISVYPDQGTKSEIKDYILRASKHGFSRIFTCLISASDNQEQVLKEFTEIVTYANELGFEVIADVDSDLFKKFNLHYTDLSFFNKIGLSGIRLDMGFSGMEEAAMSCKEGAIDIEGYIKELE